MSAYTTIKTKFVDSEILQQALKDIGFKVEVGQDMVLYNWTGTPQARTADIVIRRKHLTSISNDIGFTKERGVYKVSISDVDLKAEKTADFINRVLHRYNYLKVKKEVARQGLRLVQEKKLPDGTIELQVLSS